MYYRYIDNKKDKDILLIHSFPSYSKIFDLHIPILSQSFNILLIDLPGFGGSIDIPFTNGDQISNEIVDILKRLQISNLTIWGISFGGVVGINVSNKYKVEQLILEAAPLNSYLIHTPEFKALNIIEKLLVRTSLLNRFQSLIKKSHIFRSFWLLIYRIVNFGKRVYSIIPLEEFIQNMDFNSIFKISHLLQNFDVTNDLMTVNCKIIGIYDDTDPVIEYEKSIEILNKKSARILNYRYYEHCSSLVEGNSVAKDIAALIG